MATSNELATAPPTYGELMDLLEEAEQECSSGASGETLQYTLYSKFTKLYPHLKIGRPKRLHEAVNRIVAPTRPSLLGPSKLTGSDLVLYRNKKWVPRVTNSCTDLESIVYPVGLLAYGLDEKLLFQVYSQVNTCEHEETSVVWRIRGIPDNGFYRDLHRFLKQWSHTCDSTKVSIGKFYLAVDKNLREKGLSAMNAYHFIDRVASGNYPSDEPVKYLETDGVLDARECTELVQKVMMELTMMKKELDSTQTAFMLATKELRIVISQFKAAQDLFDTNKQNC